MNTSQFYQVQVNSSQTTQLTRSNNQQIGFYRGTKQHKDIYCKAQEVQTLEFPINYQQAIRQMQLSVDKALQNQVPLQEIQFPTAGITSRTGDGEGQEEMTYNLAFLREFLTNFERQGHADKVRVFFPDFKEMEFAQQQDVNISMGRNKEDQYKNFCDTPFRMDYLTKPTGFMDIGLNINKIDVAQKVQQDDYALLIAYPYFNPQEMQMVQQLYEGAAKRMKKSVIVFNGELDKIRSGYYPKLFYPKIGKLAENFLPDFEQVYYIHNFVGKDPGALFRAYPGPWTVYRRDRTNPKNVKIIHTQEKMPTLGEVSQNILQDTGAQKFI